jgi:PAS domain S-box-containing protein
LKLKDSDDKKNLSNEFKKQPELKGLIQINDIDKVGTLDKDINHSTAILNSIFEGPKNIIAFSLDRNYHYIFFNQTHSQTMKNIWGVDIEIGGNMLNYISIPEDREKAKINFDRAISGENFIELEEYGEETLCRMYWENIYNPIQSGKDIIGLTVFCIDITERERSNEKLRQSEEKFRAVAESATDAIITVDSNGIITFFNHSLLQLFGYTKKELSGQPVSTFIPEGHKNEHINGMKSFKSGQLHRTGKTSMAIGLKKDGTEFPCEMSLSAWKSGENTYFTSIIRDLTERQKVEEALIESEEKFRRIFHNANDMISLNLMSEEGMPGRFLEVNDVASERLGYTRDELLNMSPPDIVAPENQVEMPGNARVLIEKGHNTFEIVHLTKDGKRIPVEVNNHLINYNGREICLAISRDITERKKAEDALKLSRIRLSNSMDLAHLANWELDPYKQMFIFNDKFYSMLGTTAEIEGSYHMSIEYYIKEYVHPEDAQFIAEGMKKSLAIGEPTFGKDFENRIIRRDGATRYLAIHMRVIPATESRITHVYGAVQDITEQKMVEEKLKESLEEKEMLLKEIHHRVKNNLMVISSLLNLQSQYIKDKEAQGIFKESQNRAKSMALIHERLYRSTDLKRIDFGDYIRTLTNDLFHTYVTDPSKVRLNMNVENLMVDINTTVPLGLIVNELLTNSMKHGFIDGREGEIHIDFYKENKTFVLIVGDTGVGFPKYLDFQNTSTLGLQLVNNLTNQLDGNIELNRDNGTEFKITFKEQYK